MLADARHDEPVPPEVAARLDEVLAGLHADPPPTSTPPPGPGEAADEPEPPRDRRTPAAGGPRDCRATCSPRPRCSRSATGPPQVIGDTLGRAGQRQPVQLRRRGRREGRARHRDRRGPLRCGGRPAGPPLPDLSRSSASGASSPSTRGPSTRTSTHWARPREGRTRPARRGEALRVLRPAHPGGRLAHPRGGVRRSSDAGRLPPARGRRTSGSISTCATPRSRGRPFRSVTLPAGE